MVVGDLVQTWVYAGSHYSATGRIDDADLIFGAVESVGPKTFTVVWESGLRNRIRNGTHGINRVSKDLESEVRRIMKRALS